MTSLSDADGRRRFHAWPISLWFVSAAVFANGTPIARCDLAATGNIVPVRQEGIELQQETLQVVVDGDWLSVRVEYRFLNPNGATTIPYGFPVDYENPEWCNDCDDVSDKEKARVGKPLRDVRIEANGKATTTREIVEPVATGVPPQPFRRTWILTDLPFPENDHSTVTVSYRVRSLLNDWAWSTSFKPAYSKRKFRYVLSPSANWGNGKVARLDIDIDIAKLTRFGGKLMSITPAGHSQQGGHLRWQLRDADLHELQALGIEYDDEVRLVGELLARQRIPATDIVRAQASSTLADATEPGRHDIAKVLDGDLASAWCEGAAGDGAGQSLTFEFRPGVSVEAIAILNGYAKSGGVYLANGRVTKMTAKIAEQKPISATLPEHDFGQLSPGTLASFIDWIVDDPPYRDTPTVTLTLDAATPGTKHADTCISEIYFMNSASNPPDATE
jgi:hypothetical protein